MKKIFKALGTIAMLAAVVLSFAACDDLMNLIGGDDKNDDKNSGTTNYGKTLTLSGQVYVEKMNYDPPSVSFEAYNEDALTVSARGMTEKGTIKNGQLSITLGTPTNLSDDSFGDDDMTVSPSGAKGYSLSLYIENSGQNLRRENHTIVGNTSEINEMVETVERVQYFYVDRDVTISSKEKTETYDYGSVTFSTTMKAFSLALKVGWNTLYMKQQTSFNEEINTIEINGTISLANPSSLKWVLDDSGYGYGDSGGDEGSGIGDASGFEAGGGDIEPTAPSEPYEPVK